MSFGIIASEVIKSQGRKELGKWESPEHRQKRKKQLGKAVLGIAMLPGVVAGGYYGWQDGWGTGFAQQANITNETSVSGGQATMTEVNLDFKQTCWTSSTVDVQGSMGKTANKIGDWEALWRSGTASFLLENKECVDPSAVTATRNSQTNEIKVIVKDPSAITTETAIIAGTLQHHFDGAPLNNFAASVVENLKATPIVEDAELVKLAESGMDKADSNLLNMAIVEGQYDALSCAQVAWPMTEPAIEKGLKNTVLPGVLLYEPHFDENNIHVFVGDKPIAEVGAEQIGTKSNIDEQHDALTKALKEHGELSATAGQKGECKPADNLKIISTPKAVSSLVGDQR